MAIEAIAWAFEQDIRPSTAKFVFIGLCNYVQVNGTAWCALSRLSVITSQDIKTVRRAMDSLQKDGWIRDTGKKAGQTGQIPLYAIRLPDAVVLKMPKATNPPRKGYQSSRQRLPKTVPDPYLIRTRTKQLEEKPDNSNVEALADHLAKLKAATKGKAE